MARHPHADLMIQAAENWDGLEFRCRVPTNPWRDDWERLTNITPQWYAEFEYHLRPIRKPRYQKRVEIPGAETEAPAHGVEYYVPSASSECHFYRDKWENHDVDREHLKRGLVYLNADDAAARARAMLETGDE